MAIEREQCRMSQFKKKKFGPPFVMLGRQMLDSDEWKELSKSEMIAYIYLKKNYNGCNNGQIPLRYSWFKGIFAGATLSRALKGLATKGWIEKTTLGGLYRYSCEYKLTGKYDTRIY